MHPDHALKAENVRKIGKDSSDTFGVRGAGASWQASFGKALNTFASSATSKSSGTKMMQPNDRAVVIVVGPVGFAPGGQWRHLPRSIFFD